MSSAPTARESAPPIVVHLVGDADLHTYAMVRQRLEDALRLGRPVVVDLGDCTFLDGATVELLVEASRRALDRALGFVVALPFSSNALVRRVLLEVLPEETGLRIAPSVRVACSLLARSASESVPPAERWRLHAIRASVWENASRLDELRAERDALLFEQRRIREQRARRPL